MLYVRTNSWTSHKILITHPNESWNIRHFQFRQFIDGSVLISSADNYFFNSCQKALAPPIAQFVPVKIDFLSFMSWTEIALQFDKIKFIQIRSVEIAFGVTIYAIHFCTIQQLLPI